LAESFDIQETSHGAAVVLRLQGRLDAKSSRVFLERCKAAHAANRHLVVNLSGVTFIASSGVGALLGLAEEYRQGTTHVRFVCLSTAVASVIGLLNLDQFLAIHDSEQSAFDALAA